MAPKKRPQPLSLKELKVMEYIEQFIQDRAVSPTYQEIKDHFGFASFNSVQRYLKQLQDKNYIYIPGGNQKRALQVLHSSHTFSNSLADRMVDASGRSIPNNNPSPTQLVKKVSQLAPPAVGDLRPPGGGHLSLPLLGRVAAGAPIEAFLNDEYIEVPSSLVRNPAKSYALIVQGQSMIEDGILDGDVILVQKQTYANNGDTIVAMVDNQATVKRFYLHRNRNIHSNPQSHAQLHSPEEGTQPSQNSQQVELRPANSSMKSMWYESNAVDIQGLVVGLIRRF